MLKLREKHTQKMVNTLVEVLGGSAKILFPFKILPLLLLSLVDGVGKNYYFGVCLLVIPPFISFLLHLLKLFIIWNPPVRKSCSISADLFI